jgi:hypothetical protein
VNYGNGNAICVTMCLDAHGLTDPYELRSALAAYVADWTMTLLSGGGVDRLRDGLIDAHEQFATAGPPQLWSVHSHVHAWLQRQGFKMIEPVCENGLIVNGLASGQAMISYW